jgi:multidrug efflux system membrane fusion protein
METTTKSPGISDLKGTKSAAGSPVGSPPRKRRRGLAAIVWLLLLVAIGYGGYRYYQYTHQAQASPSGGSRRGRPSGSQVSVVVTTVRTGDMPVNLRGLGTVTPFNSVLVKSRVDGQLTAIHFTEGQMVNEGDLLVEIDPRPYQVLLEQAEGQLSKDQAARRDAQVNLDRYNELWKAQVIPKQQLDTQAATVGQFDGAIESDKASIDNAKLQLTYSRITAPISGRIGLRLIDIGNIIHATDANGLVIIDQMQPISVLFTIPADNLPPVLKKLHDGIKLRVDAYDRDDRNKISSGTLLTVDNQIDTTTGTSRLKAVFDNEDMVLFPNQFVNCRLLLDMKRGVTIVPAPAIQRGPQGTFVYVVQQGNTVSAVPVTTGITEGEDVEVSSGLKAAQTVVIEGQDKLQDGMQVDVRTSSTPTAPGGRQGRQTPQVPGATPSRGRPGTTGETTPAGQPTTPGSQAAPGVPATPGTRAVPGVQPPASSTPHGRGGAPGRGGRRPTP